MDQGEPLFLFTSGLCAARLCKARKIRKRNRLICEQEQGICPDFFKVNSETEEYAYIGVKLWQIRKMILSYRYAE